MSDQFNFTEEEQKLNAPNGGKQFKAPNDGMNTLSTCMNKVIQNGYTENFEMSESGLKAPSSERHYKPEQVQIVNFYRFEGESDPSDNSILYVIETNDGTKGILVNAYGAYANAKIGEFVKSVEDITKKGKGESHTLAS